MKIKLNKKEILEEMAVNRIKNLGTYAGRQFACVGGDCGNTTTFYQSTGANGIGGEWYPAAGVTAVQKEDHYGAPKDMKPILPFNVPAIPDAAHNTWIQKSSLVLKHNKDTGKYTRTYYPDYRVNNKTQFADHHPFVKEAHEALQKNSKALVNAPKKPKLSGEINKENREFHKGQHEYNKKRQVTK